MTLLYPLFEKGVSLFMENPAAQSFWFIAMIIWICGFIVLNDRTTVKFFIVSTCFWILHFIFLWNYAALWAACIGQVRFVLSLKYQKSIKILAGVIIASLWFWFFSFDGTLISLLPLIATSVSSYGFFFLERARLRLLLGFVSIMWFSYHYKTGSMSWVLNEIIVQCTIWYSIYKFTYWEEKKEKILTRLRRKITRPNIPVRINFWRYIFLRDKNRFE